MKYCCLDTQENLAEEANEFTRKLFPRNMGTKFKNSAFWEVGEQKSLLLLHDTTYIY